MKLNREGQEQVLRAYCKRIMAAFNEPRWYRSPETSHFDHPVLPPAWFAGLVGGNLVDGEKLYMEFVGKDEAIEAAVNGHPGLCEWPRDAITVVAARAGEADLRHMEDIHECACRDCETKLHADTRSVRTARRIIESGRTGHTGNEVKFFCRDCVLFYVPAETKIDGRGNPA